MKFLTLSLPSCGALLTTLKAKLPTTKEDQKIPKNKKEEVATKDQQQEEDVLNYQEVLKSLGRTGSWQLGLWTLLAFLVLLDGLCQSLFEFTAFTPKFRCNIPFCEHPKNTTYLEQVSQNFPHYVIHGIPQEFLEAGDSCEYLGIAGMPDEIQEAAILNKESCDFYVSETERNSSDLILTRCHLDSLIYDTSVTSSSIVTSFQLSCHRQWIKTCIDILHQVAIILGTLAFGLLADWIGRSKALIFGLVFTSVTGILAGFSSSNGGVGGYAFFHFCFGLGKSGLCFTAFILMLEISGEVLALLLMPIQTMGLLLASFLAYFIPIWTRLHWTAFGLGLIWTLPLAGFIAESPRWLIAKKKYDKARSIVKYAAKRNKRELKMQTLHPDKKIEVEATSNLRTPKDLFKEMNSFYKWWLLNLSLQWLVLGLCSTKIKAEANSDNSNSTSTSSAAVANPHANLCYEAMTSLVGFSLAIVLIRLWGCRPLLTFSQFWTAFMLIIQSLGLYFGRPDVSLFGHLAINISLKASLACVQLFTAFAAPTTSNRGAFIGLFSALYCLASLISYLLTLMSFIWLHLGLAFVASIAAFAAFFLPEISSNGGLHLPERWEDIIELHKVKPKSYLEFQEVSALTRLKRLLCQSSFV